MNNFKFAKQVIRVFEEIQDVDVNIIHNEDKINYPPTKDGVGLKENLNED